MLVGATFFTPIQTGSGAHPASYAIGTGSFPGVKRPSRGVDHTSLSNEEVKDRVYIGPLWAFVSCCGVKSNEC